MDNLKYRHPERARLAATRLSRREHIAAAQDQRHRHVGGAVTPSKIQVQVESTVILFSIKL